MKKSKVALDAREFTKFWFKSNNKTALEVRKNPVSFSSFCLDYGEFFHKVRMNSGDFRARPLQESALKHAFVEYINATAEADVLSAFDGLLCKAENLAPLIAWVTGVTGTADQKDVAIMAHWLWQVKRRGTGQSVKHQIMPVLYGLQGGGKTVALEKLIAPISNYRLTISMSQLGDERVFEGLSRNYVTLFDELQGIERTDMNSLKKQITNNSNSYRKLYTHEMTNIPMRCSFIGATNKPVAESLNDSTGMRRFWELATLPKLDWAMISSIDYTALWQGIDENKEDGYLIGETLQSVLKHQQALVNKDDLDEFISQHDIQAAETSSDVITVLNCDLYDAYVFWAGRVGITSRLNAIWFGRKLSKRLPYEMAKSKDGVAQRAYKINLHNKLSNLKLNS